MGRIGLSQLTVQSGFSGMKVMAKHRTHSVEFKRQVSQEYLSVKTLHRLPKRNDISRQLIRIWLEKYQAGELNEDAAPPIYSRLTRRALLRSNLVGKQALALEFPKGALRAAPLRKAGVCLLHTLQ